MHVLPAGTRCQRLAGYFRQFSHLAKLLRHLTQHASAAGKQRLESKGTWPTAVKAWPPDVLAEGYPCSSITPIGQEQYTASQVLTVRAHCAGLIHRPAGGAAESARIR